MVALRPKLALLLAALVAFGGSLAGTFHFDDSLLLHDAVLASPSGWWEVFRPLQTRPLAWLTFWINRQISTAPALWHLFNLLLHVAAVMLVWRVLRNLLTEKAAFAGTLVFAVHPIQAQAVAYVYSRAIVLATLLCLVSLDRWLAGKRVQAVFWFVAALLAKEEVAAFPLFLVLLEAGGKWMRSGQQRAGLRRVWKPLGVMVALSVCAGARVIWATSVLPGTRAAANAGISPVDYLATQGTVLWRYVRLLVWPAGFSVDPEITVAGIAGWLGWIAILAILGAMIWRPKSRSAGLWLLAALILLLPSSSIFPAADLAADRRLYLPMLAIGASLGIAVQQVRAQRWLVPAAGVVWVVLSVQQMAVWRSERSLWSEAVAQAPTKIRPRLQLARTMPLADAAALLQRTRELAPDDPRVSSELGRVYLEMGKPERALPEFGTALAADPGNPMALNNRGAALLALGQGEAAAGDFRRALRADPCSAPALENLFRMGEAADVPPDCRFTPEQRRAIERSGEAQ